MSQVIESSDRSRPIRIVEVGPRDGLQNEPALIPTETKIAFINALSRTGVVEIEAGSFVSPKAVPQMADSDDVFRKIERVPGVTYSALIPNMHGLERARTVAALKIAIFTAASETFTRRNINATIQESLEGFKSVVAGSKRDGMAVRGYVSTAWFCPYEGRIEPVRVLDVMKRLLDLGVDEISLGDTVGKASPADVRMLLDLVLSQIPRSQISLHFHDTYGMAVANVLVAWGDYGIESFDSSAGGLGGCPYAPGASGNVPTEDVIYALKASGATVPVDELKVVAATRQIERYLSRPLNSRLSQIKGQNEYGSYEMTITRSTSMMKRDLTDTDILAQKVMAGDTRAVSRLITLLENRDPDGFSALRSLGTVSRRAEVIGMTGYPGTGKSTLIDQLICAYRRLGKRVGVLAVDISSPLTGGAVLGDRIRMQDHSGDKLVYIRSMATRGHQGGLAQATHDGLRVLEAAGYDVILIETVGVGQNELDITHVAQTVVAVVAPGLGDEIQAMKAGLLEVVNIIVVNKGDMAGADATLRDLREWCPQVLRTMALKGEGVPELISAIAEHQRLRDLGRAPN